MSNSRKDNMVLQKMRTQMRRKTALLRMISLKRNKVGRILPVIVMGLRIEEKFSTIIHSRTLKLNLAKNLPEIRSLKAFSKIACMMRFRLEKAQGYLKKEGTGTIRQIQKKLRVIELYQNQNTQIVFPIITCARKNSK